MDDLDLLRLLPLRVVAEAREPIELPPFAGSTLRGAFGRALRETLCVAVGAECSACRLATDCSYPYLFETAPPPGAKRLAAAPFVPHPYALEAPAGPLRLAVGEPLEFGLTLVGRATTTLPVVAQALLRAGERGLTAARGRFRVRGIDGAAGRVPLVAGDPPVLVAGRERAVTRASAFESDLSSGRARVTFAAPCRLLRGGRPAADIPFHVLVRGLLRRASSLLEFHEGVDLDLDFRGIIAAAEQVETVESRLSRTNRVRYSARQDRSMNLHGLQGQVTYEGGISPFQRLLALGQAVGVGKGTTFGLGRIRVESAR